MSRSVCILGRQPALGLAELESLFGTERLTPIGTTAAIIDIDPSVLPFSRLGGSLKAGKLLYEFDTTNWQVVHDYLLKTFPEHLKYVGEGKLTIGLSTYGVAVNPTKIQGTALSLKKVAKQHGKSVRVVPNKSHELSSAQVLHNKLFTANGWELFFVQNGNKIVMAQTSHIQDIEAYSARDQARPKRDAKVGMLPPKLAQIINNLASGSLIKDESEMINKPLTVLDPFCGTGVLLQEALLMGMDAFGSDLDTRMMMFAEENLEWLQSKFPISNEFHVTVGDATDFKWQNFDMVACETYLGRPFSAKPSHDVLKQVISDVNTIHKKFLQNMAEQTTTGTRLCLAVPAWKIGSEFIHLPSLDHLEELGYTRASFKHADDRDLIYHREGQIVGRELVTLIRK